jgi:hypothetical protein
MAWLVTRLRRRVALLSAGVCNSFAPFEKFVIDFRIGGVELVDMLDWVEEKTHWLLTLAVVASEDSRFILRVNQAVDIFEVSISARSDVQTIQIESSKLLKLSRLIFPVSPWLLTNIR